MTALGWVAFPIDPSDEPAPGKEIAVDGVWRAVAVSSDGALVDRAATRRQRARQLAARLGVSKLSVAWRGLAVREYQRKLDRDKPFRAWWNAEGSALVETHWGHEVVESELDQLHTGSQIYELTEMLRRRMGALGDANVLDAGASDGFFLSRVGAGNGVGVNFLWECGRKIQSDGANACVSDLERLPFPDNSFDSVICCETLEHVWNPIAAINELARVCRGTIHITIPWLPHTRINAKPPGWPEVEGHIFEFSEIDFARVLTHARVRVRYRDRVQVLPQPRNPLVQWWLGQFMYPSYFPMLQYYELEPVA